ncbi:phosphorylated CTD interacting factor 1 WW domain [Klosneuvirus KNV1]|uniref:Phosphorylated CTD interacting factor 1 WW domain n=1 Tax=Klosneuvirus KNV1 TaxID=1977640 RepID=A0A1V0SID8_9VIRU|nr:phosphorylated CTD interacting factor 1 WW domain [Klosneuvirus KNV1]
MIITSPKLINIYLSENIKLNIWFEFIKDIVNQIKQITDMKYESIYQGVTRFYTYVIGMVPLTTFVFFPNTKNLDDYKQILTNELTFYHKLDHKTIDIILQIIKKQNHEARKKIKNTIESLQLPKNIQINLTDMNHKIKFNIICQDYQNNFILSKKHYHRLKTMYNNRKDNDNDNKEDVDFWICLLLLRYRYYGKDLESFCLAIDIFYEFIKKYQLESNALEAFAGSLNSTLHDYCSLFYDIEKKFGSNGSFFQMDLNQYKRHIIVANPPYIAEIIHAMFDKLLDYLDRRSNSTILISIPDWRSTKEYEKDLGIQINLGLKERKRYETQYQGYSNIRHSKYFKYVIAIENLSYYNFFADTRRNINVPTLIVVLSNNNNNELSEKFKKFIIEKV